MSAVFLDYESVSDGDLDTAPLYEVVPQIRFFKSTDPSQVAERIADAQIVLTNKMRLTRQKLEAAPRLELITLAATGTDNVDLAAARELGIAVCNVRSYCTASVVQHAWGMILALTHHLLEYRQLAIGGDWARGAQFTLLDLPFRELAGRRLGVVGWGELGRGVARVAQAFGMQVDIANRPGSPTQPGRLDLRELLPMVDVLSLHCPLTDATRGMMGAREFALMKPDALFINTARGGLVDGRALAAALKARRLGGAGIDVLPQEPPVDGDPLLEPDIPNLLITPHIAWAARDARQRCLNEMAANIRDFMAGGRRGRVD
jgi:glycerate dehydrogenase